MAASFHPLAANNAKLSWNEEAQIAFEDLRERLSGPSVLAFPNIEKPFHIFIDACEVAVRAALEQRQQNWGYHPVRFVDRIITRKQQRSSTFEQKALTIVLGLKESRHFLLCWLFISYSDYQALRNAFAKTNIYGRLSRWLNIMVEYGFGIWHHLREQECRT